jgi:hypothetical protein
VTTCDEQKFGLYFYILLDSSIALLFSPDTSFLNHISNLILKTVMPLCSPQQVKFVRNTNAGNRIALLKPFQ